MLTQAQKRAWIAALRSGTYQQGTGTLFKPTTGSYCCLGVLAKINNKALDHDCLMYQSHSDIWPSKLPEPSEADGRPVSSTGHLPNTPELCKDLEALAVLYPSLTGILPTMIPSLAMLNDHGVSFTDIATLIEKYLPTSD